MQANCGSCLCIHHGGTSAEICMYLCTKYSYSYSRRRRRATSSSGRDGYPMEIEVGIENPVYRHYYLGGEY